MGKMAKRRRRKFTSEYKAEVVRLVRTSGKSIGALAAELQLTEATTGGLHKRSLCWRWIVHSVGPPSWFV